MQQRNQPPGPPLHHLAPAGRYAALTLCGEHRATEETDGATVTPAPEGQMAIPADLCPECARVVIAVDHALGLGTLLEIDADSRGTCQITDLNSDADGYGDVEVFSIEVTTSEDDEHSWVLPTFHMGTPVWNVCDVQLTFTAEDAYRLGKLLIEASNTVDRGNR